MHRWLVDHGWVNDYPGIGSRIMSYIAFFFIPGCTQMAFLEWLFSRGGGIESGR